MATLRHIAFVTAVILTPLVAVVMALIVITFTLALWPACVWRHCYHPARLKGTPQARHGARLANSKANPANFVRNLLIPTCPVQVPMQAGSFVF
jgi:hypothetical protein